MWPSQCARSSGGKSWCLVARIVGVKERLGQPLWGRYLCDALGRTRQYALTMDFFDETAMGAFHSNLDSRGVLPGGHSFRVLRGVVFCHASSVELCQQFATDVTFAVEIQGRPRLELAGARQGWSHLEMSDSLAALRGETVGVAGHEQFRFLVCSGPALVDAVCRVEESTDPGRRVELLGCLLGLRVRDVL